MKIPELRPDAEKVCGLVFFGRMLDKIRLKAAGRLPADYSTGVADRTSFDARCTRFLHVEYADVVERTMQGGTDEEILEWCFHRGRRPSEDEIAIWNEFLAKRGWRDAGSEELKKAKISSGLADRDDIQTWFDLHLAEEC